VTGHGELDLYQTAYLAGGRDRVVDTALVVLVSDGRVRVSAPGELATVNLTRRHPVEAAVLDAIGTGGHRSVDTILWRLIDDERLLDVEDRLRRAGLLRRGKWLGRYHSLDRRLVVRTTSGRRTLRYLSAEPPADLVAGGTGAMPVALGGRERLPDRELCAAVFDGPREVRHFHRGSRSSNLLEAAADARQDSRQTANVLHTPYNQWSLSPSGPAAPRVREPRRSRGSK
jgi:hypothetical protein